MQLLDVWVLMSDEEAMRDCGVLGATNCATVRARGDGCGYKRKRHCWKTHRQDEEEEEEEENNN